jgi:hypothetical protein
MLDATVHSDARPPAAGVVSAVGFTPERLAWLVRLRWVALLGIVLAGTLAAFGAFPGVSYPVLFAVAFVATLYNAAMWRDLRRGRGS